MSDDLKTNYTKLNKKYQELKKENKVLEKALELSCKELNKNIDNLCEYCEYQNQNIYYGSCDCDEQFEIDRTVNYFKFKAKEMMKNE